MSQAVSGINSMSAIEGHLVGPVMCMAGGEYRVAVITIRTFGLVLIEEVPLGKISL